MVICSRVQCLSGNTDPLHELIDLSLVQENSQSIALVKSTLETLLKFLNWIPLGYIFETKLISSLIYKVCLCV